MNEHQALIIRALEGLKGDDTYRAKMAFRGLTPEQMRQQYGESGRTREEIVADYERRDAEVDAAIAWVTAQG